MNLGNLLSASAERNPRKTAIVLEVQNISYEQLERSTTSLARWFLRQGWKPGGRIAVHCITRALCRSSNSRYLCISE
jgi:acyl-CoA synthetase (AMP-forming)/AMP-acid ligase II